VKGESGRVTFSPVNAVKDKKSRLIESGGERGERIRAQQCGASNFSGQATRVTTGHNSAPEPGGSRESGDVSTCTALPRSGLVSETALRAAYSRAL